MAEGKKVLALVRKEMSGRSKTGKPKCTNQEHTWRILKVADLLCDGYGIREICRDKTVMEWGLTREHIAEYIKKAWKDIHEFRKEEMEIKIDKAIVERDRIKLRAVNKNDFGSALKAMDGRDKIEGILKEKEPAFLFNFGAENLTPEMKERLDKELSFIFGKERKK